MSDPGPTGGYAPVESFESERVTAMAADGERVVLGTEVGTVDVVTTDDRTTVEFDAPVTDLAVGNRVYVLAGDTITALSTAGTRVWSVERPGASQIAALPEADVLGAVTDADSLVGFDGETGGEEFEVDRPHADVTDDPGFFGTDGAFVLVAWSFLAVRNLDGSERFDRNLDGAIESAGIVGDTVVVSLKDERVVGIDAMTGEKRWERELAVTDLPDRGEDALLFTAEGQLVSLAPDGTYTTVSDLPSGNVYPTSDGRLFCAVSGGTVAVYCSTGDLAAVLDVSFDGAELVPGETDAVAFEVRNAGDRPVTGRLRADGEGVTLRDADWEVDLAPGESATRSVEVDAVSADDAAAIAVTADGDQLASVSLPVADAPSGSLDAAVELDAVADGAANLSVTVENAGDAPATGLRVSPGDVRLDALAPGESATVAVETPFDPGTSVPVAVRGDDAVADAEVSLPERACEVAVETTDGFVDAVVENPTEATLVDDLVVAGEPFDAPVERRVELPPESRLVFALRPDWRPDAASAEASLVGLGVGETARLDWGAPRRGARPSDDRGRRRGAVSDRRPADSGRRAERPPREDTPPRRETGRSESRRRREEPARTEQVGSGGRNSDPPRRDSDAADRRDATEPEASAGRESTDPSTEREADESSREATDSSASGATLSTDRTIEDTDPARTQGIRERVTVTNDGEGVATDVSASFPDATATIGTLAPGESTAVERHHAFADTGRAEIPAGTVTAADADDVSLDGEPISVAPAEFAADVAVEADDGYRVRAELTNDRDVACTVERIGVHEVGVWHTDVEVPPGETVEWSRRIDAPGVSASAVEAGVEYAFADREQAQWGTLAAIPDETESDDAGGTDALSVSIGEETRVSGGYGSVVLVVENTGGSAVEDVGVEADGEAVSDLMYGGGESGVALAPGEMLTHFVDVETEGEATIPVTLSVGDESAERLDLSGPAPADEDDWSAEALADWRVEREDASGDGSGRIASAFESA